MTLFSERASRGLSGQMQRWLDRAPGRATFAELMGLRGRGQMSTPTHLAEVVPHLPSRRLETCLCRTTSSHLGEVQNSDRLLVVAKASLSSHRTNAHFEPGGTTLTSHGGYLPTSTGFPPKRADMAAANVNKASASGTSALSSARSERRKPTLITFPFHIVFSVT